MRRLLFVFLSLLTFSCGHKDNPKVITVAASSVPHAQLLHHVKPVLEKEGYTLHILEMDDYNIPNRALNEKEVDANFFQHAPFLKQQIEQFGYRIQCDARIHLEPMALYSVKLKSIQDIPSGASIAIPNDPTNEYRALRLLADQNLIALRPGALLEATAGDVVENPKKIKFKEIDAAMLPRVLKDVDAAVIPTNYALQVGLRPKQDALAIESKDSPYANIIAIRIGDSSKPKLQALKKAMLSEEVRQYINDTYKGAIIPILSECSQGEDSPSQPALPNAENSSNTSP